MNLLRNLAIFLLSGLGFAACSITHDVDSDYNQYLANNQGRSNLPSTSAASDYYLTPKTQNHSYEFRAYMTGVANLWTLELGKMLDATLESNDAQLAFDGLKKENDIRLNSSGLLIFDLLHYSFEDFGAHISLVISFLQFGNEIFTKTYQVDGKSQGGKMFWGGAFAQKNAVHQSTKLAIDEVLRQLVRDLNTSTDLPPRIRGSDSSATFNQLRAVTEDRRQRCGLISTVTKGAGGSGDPALYTESAMQKALSDAYSMGADSYFVVRVETTASGASVVIEALDCNRN